MTLGVCALRLASHLSHQPISPHLLNMAMVSLSNCVGPDDRNYDGLLPLSAAHPFYVNPGIKKHLRSKKRYAELAALNGQMLSCADLMDKQPDMCAPEWGLGTDGRLNSSCYVGGKDGFLDLWGFDLMPWLRAQTEEYRTKLAKKAFGWHDKDGKGVAAFLAQFAA